MAVEIFGQSTLKLQIVLLLHLAVLSYKEKMGRKLPPSQKGLEQTPVSLFC